MRDCLAGAGSTYKILLTSCVLLWLTLFLPAQLFQFITNLCYIYRYTYIYIRQEYESRQNRKKLSIFWTPQAYWIPNGRMYSLVMVCTFRSQRNYQDSICFIFYLKTIYSSPYHNLPCLVLSPSSHPLGVIRNRTRPDPDLSALLPHDHKEETQWCAAPPLSQCVRHSLAHLPLSPFRRGKILG